MKQLFSKYLLPVVLFSVFSIGINHMFGYEFKLDRTLIMLFFIIILFDYKYGKICLLGMSVLAALFFPVSWYYGSPNLTIISALLETNINESIEFMYDIPLLAILLSLVYLSLVCFFLFKVKYRPIRHKRRILLLFTLLVIWRPLKLYAADKNNRFIYDVRFTPVEFLADLHKSYHAYFDERDKIRAQINSASGWEVSSSHQKYKNYILVIGESVRKEYLNAYGFKQANTPFMSSTPGIVWDGLIAPGPNTYTSVIRLLSVNDGKNVELNKNIISLANESGFDTSWLSNQGRIGDTDTVISSIAYYSKDVLFTKKGSYKDIEVPDSALLPHLQNVLNNKSELPKLIVVHLMGSHQSFCKRVNNRVKFNYINRRMSCYITSLYNTDSLLKNIRSMLEDTNEPFSMVYVADHGLGHPNKKKDNLKHNSEVKQAYEVPLFITSSDDDDHRYINRQRAGHDFINFLADWIGVESQQLDGQYNFFNKYDDQGIKVNTGNGKLVEFLSLRDDVA